MSKKIIYIDDEELNLVLFKSSFKRIYDVFATSSQMLALDLIDKEDIKVIITDYKMPIMNGMELIERIKAQKPETVCMIMSAYLENDNLIDHSKVYEYISKPYNRDHLCNLIEKAFTIVGRV
jgi:DNA-binding NtrC family response regulator